MAVSALSIVRAQALTIEALDKRVAQLESEIATLKASPSVAPAPQRPARPAYVPPAPTAAQVAYRALREEYRAAAIAGHSKGVLPSFAQFERALVADAHCAA